MSLDEENAKEKLINRLRRIEGQVRGIQNMIAEERNCREIMQQLSAVRSAIQSVSSILAENYTADCLMSLNEKSTSERNEMIKDLLQMLGRGV
jgi:DNA-binding FrmR family transcriptional regulator